MHLTLSAVSEYHWPQIRVWAEKAELSFPYLDWRYWSTNHLLHEAQGITVSLGAKTHLKTMEIIPSVNELWPLPPWNFVLGARGVWPVKNTDVQGWQSAAN